jgi:hypothetical protein
MRTTERALSAWAQRATAILAATLAVAAFATPGVAAGPECGKASAELGKAQQALSNATRDVDTAASAYGKCMEGSKACPAQKAAFDAAQARKSKAQSDFKAAQAKKQSACS